MSIKPIKKIAGELLLYFYALQRKNYSFLHDLIIKIDDDELETDHLGDDDTSIDLMGITENINDLYNALSYLNDSGYLEYKSKALCGGAFMHGLKLTSRGVDIIEGIEKGEEERKQFNVVFNIKLADNINVESLIKNELGSLISLSKVGLL